MGAEAAMNPQNAFLHAAFEDPEDLGVRLIFADFLQDRGDPRGEFLRCHVERAQWVPDVHRRDALHLREAALVAEHSADWLGELEPYCRDWRFERGTVRVTMEAR